MAFDRRFAMGLIASSGAGGTKLFRRDFGENLENLAATGAYHWMAGNYLKYSAEESAFGRKTADDLPVDSHMTLALCAPRPTFISHGIPERGDAHWLDPFAYGAVAYLALFVPRTFWSGASTAIVGAIVVGSVAFAIAVRGLASHQIRTGD